MERQTAPDFVRDGRWLLLHFVQEVHHTVRWSVLGTPLAQDSGPRFWRPEVLLELLAEKLQLDRGELHTLQSGAGHLLLVAEQTLVQWSVAGPLELSLSRIPNMSMNSSLGSHKGGLQCRVH